MEIGVWGVYPIGGVDRVRPDRTGRSVGSTCARARRCLATRRDGRSAGGVDAGRRTGSAIRADVFDDGFEGGWRILFTGPSYPYERPTWDELLLVGQHTSRPLGMLSAIGSAILVIGLCALLSQGAVGAAGADARPRGGSHDTHALHGARAVVVAPRRSTSCDDHPDGLQPHDYGDWLLQVVVLCAAATVWSLTVGKGPLEWLVRRLSVWREK